jgi:hypothetical protein
MTACADCAESTDPRKLVREGSTKVQRALAAPTESLVPVDERRPEHAMVFAAGYAKHLRYVGPDGTVDGDWSQLFGTDTSVRLAVAAIEDVGVYRTAVKSWLRSLEDPELPPVQAAMVRALGAVFDSIGTVARRIDLLKECLPVDDPFHATLRNLIRTQLSPMLRQLIGYHRAGVGLGAVDPAVPPPTDLRILGGPVEPFGGLLTVPGLSADWAEGADVGDWATYVAVDPAPYLGAYGPGATTVDRVNHVATNNLFTAVGETFLGAYARVVADARAAVEATFGRPDHEPHYALLLAFLQLFEHARAEANTITARHLAFYYRKVLRLAERPAEPSHAHVLVELAKHVDAHPVAEGALLKAGKDDAGADAHVAVDRDLVANRASVAELRSTYRHRNAPGEQLPNGDGRLFASPVADSADGLGAELTTPDGSWHPFAEKRYEAGALAAIRMPPAEVGFAIASHHLWLAEGERRISVVVETTQPLASGQPTLVADFRCRLTTADGWLEKDVRLDLAALSPPKIPFALGITLDGNDPPIVPYDPEVHGYRFDTVMPVLLVTLRHDPARPWPYAAFETSKVRDVRLVVDVDGMRTLSLANDQGPLDPSKPFLAFGSAPTRNSALVIGSKEVFQKSLLTATVRATWMVTPVPYGTNPTLDVQHLDQGAWKALPDVTRLSSGDGVQFRLDAPPQPALAPDLSADTGYSTASRNGFIRLVLSAGYGTDAFPADLAAWVLKPTGNKPVAPVVPTVAELELDYTASEAINFRAAPSRPPVAHGRFFHVTPFGHVEPPTGLGDVPLLAPFRAGPHEPAEAELAIGIDGLRPPRDLALLFQVVDGTANPLVVKPEAQLRWSYLRGDNWVPLAADAVADGTDGLLASGIVTVAVPADATTEHSLLPSGMHWLRLAVTSGSDAVCRLVHVGAQALRATYLVRDGGSTSHTAVLPPGTITKLDHPDAAVKAVTQPFASFGGRPVETPAAYATRVSERLRHKDRAIALWDHEHLVLDAFPGIYQVRCLNHTQYDPNPEGTGTYRELAPGHVTVVTIPDLAVPDARDPLRPYTSLRVLAEVERFLAKRTSCFVQLHVRNPQFEEVRVELAVRFRPGVDETFHEKALQLEIAQFLSPWAFRGEARPTFNGTVRRSVLVDFVEERPYVDHLRDVQLFHRDPLTGSETLAGEEVKGSRAISILVSAPAHRHVVHVIHAAEVVDAERCAGGPRVD